MIYKIQPPPFYRINASIQLPASKSISNRVLILNALSGEKSKIKNLSNSEDTKVLKYALQLLETEFNVGASGTSMRFLTAYLSQQKGNWTITGTERMKNRPIKLLTDALCQLGAKIDFMEKKGFPPLRIVGNSIEGGEIFIDGGISSQYISAMLMIAPILKRGLILNLKGEVISRSYIEMTLRLMNFFGVKSSWEKNIINISPQEYRSCIFHVENDWSAASYWYEIMALSSNESSIKLCGLEEKSLQGDALGKFLFEKLGVRTTTFALEKKMILSRSCCKKKVLKYNFVNEPDLVQTFVVTCCILDIPFCFFGVQSLRIKETDRIEALRAEMRKLGYILHAYSNNIIEWDGERCEPERDPVITTYDDHRMAMAFAPACLKLNKIYIRFPEVVSKSYPSYWKDLSMAGFSINRFDEKRDNY